MRAIDLLEKIAPEHPSARRSVYTARHAMVRPTASYRFGSYLLDAAAYRLVRDGEPIPLSPRALDLLFLFADRPGALLSKEDIFGALWRDLAVTDNALTQVVSEVREALADRPATPLYIETVPRRGYRFVASVERRDLRPGRGENAEGVAPSRAIWVTDFANLADDPTAAWLSAGIAETVKNALRSVRDIRLIDRVEVGDATSGRGSNPGDVTISGAFQRAGDRVRITAQATDARTQETLAHARADGPIDDVFRVQDEIVTALVSGLRLTVPPAAEPRLHARETASLEAYRALTEGRLRLETLDSGEVPGAIVHFERAIQLDPGYTLAYVGRAHAEFWRFEASRAASQPDRDSLARAVADARHAVDLDPELAEGHAALALFLVAAGRPREAVAAGRVAVALEPANWRHQFRLGVASWGEERLQCLEAVLCVYPHFPYAQFGLAMLLVARGNLHGARNTLERAVAGAARRTAVSQDPTEAQHPAETRFPGAGLHWLLGLIHLAEGAIAPAEAAFGRELDQPDRAIFAHEFAMDAWNGRGFARLAASDAPGAVEMFGRALERFPRHARSLLGLAEAQRREGQRQARADTMTRAREAISELRANGRETEAEMAVACGCALEGRAADASQTLDDLLLRAPPGYAGWTIPVEPFAAALRKETAFQAVLARLAARAR